MVNSFCGLILILVLYFLPIFFCDVHIVPSNINMKHPFIPQLNSHPANVYTSAGALFSIELENNRYTQTISEKKCKEYTLGTRCEFSKDDFDPNLSGTARVGQFPHVVFLGTNTSNPNFVFICTGSLISPRFVLTAAMCFLGKNYGQPTTFVSLRDHNKDPTVDDKTQPLQVPIKNIHLHPDFSWSKKYNNIALAELAFDVPISDKIRPACLWAHENIAEQTTAIMTSIGSFEDDITKSKDMQKFAISIMRNKACNSTLARFISKEWDHGVDPTEICGWETVENSSYCKAHYGSPMQIVTQDEKSCIFNIIGVTSMGFPPGCFDYPIVLTRVFSYLDWIERLVWPEEYAVTYIRL